jgi:hypothetical protein
MRGRKRGTLCGGLEGLHESVSTGVWCRLERVGDRGGRRRGKEAARQALFRGKCSTEGPGRWMATRSRDGAEPQEVALLRHCRNQLYCYPAHAFPSACIVHRCRRRLHAHSGSPAPTKPRTPKQLSGIRTTQRIKHMGFSACFGFCGVGPGRGWKGLPIECPPPLWPSRPAGFGVN